MKIKATPADFMVREITAIPRKLGQQSRGQYAWYELCKSGIGTMEALQSISHCWNLRARQLSHGGLKDKQAITRQVVSLRQGPRRNLEREQYSLRYLGHVDAPISAQDVLGNEFEIRAREVKPRLAQRIARLVSKSRPVVPNYFDSQRFGSVGMSGELVAEAWCRGDYERAVYLALADNNPLDSAHERQQKRLLREHWGAWSDCKRLLARSNRRSVVTYLVDHPAGFKKAAALIHRNMRSLYIAAFQARLWNETVAGWISRFVEPARLLVWPDSSDRPTRGTLFFPTGLDANERRQMLSTTVPLPSSRPTQWDSPSNRVPIKQVLDEVCQRRNLQSHQLRFSYPRDLYFSRAHRSVILECEQLSVEQQPDVNSSNGHCQLVFRFRLGRGQYATMLLKGLELLARV